MQSLDTIGNTHQHLVSICRHIIKSVGQEAHCISTLTVNTLIHVARRDFVSCVCHLRQWLGQALGHITGHGDT